MNAWLRPRDQLSDATIAERSGLKSTKKVNQIGRVAKTNPALAHKVASGEVAAGTAVRNLKEDPAGNEEANANGQNNQEVFILRNRRLISGFHEARLKAGATKQSAHNKAISMYMDSLL